MRALLRSLPVWITVSAIVAVSGFIVAQSTDDNAPPYDERPLSTVAWISFLGASLVFILLCLVAGLLAARRTRLDGR
jgi:hypothetical protein